MLMVQVVVTIWYFGESVKSTADLARAILMGSMPLVAVFTALSVLRSMRKDRD